MSNGTFARLNMNRRYFLSFILIIVAIMVTSYYYGTYYPGSKSLPCSTISECVLSYSTAMFNGYTETLSGLSFGNSYENVAWTVVILLVLPAVAILTGYKKYLNVIVAGMIISQILFVLIYPRLIEPHLTNNPVFGGGLSLFDTFSLISIITMLILYFYRLQKRDMLIRNKSDFVTRFAPSIVIFTVVLYIVLSIANLVSFSNSNQGFVLTVSIVLCVVAFLALLGYILFFVYLGYKRNTAHYGLGPELLTGRILLFSLLIGFSSAILLSSYLLPVFVFYKGLTIKSILNPHNFGWPVFVLVTLILLKLNIFVPTAAYSNRQ